MTVIDLRQVNEGQRLVLADETECLIGEAVGPGRRTVMGISRSLNYAERNFDGGDRRLLRIRQRIGDVVALRVEIAERRERRLTTGRSVRSASVKVIVPDAMSSVVLPSSTRSAIAPPDVATTGASLVPVIVMVNVLNVGLVVRREIVVDPRDIGQRQRLAGGRGSRRRRPETL